MSLFENGIQKYVHAVAIVENYFPVDETGRPYICCEQCFYKDVDHNVCNLNRERIAFPHKYVGGECPLVPVDDKQYTEITNIKNTIEKENHYYEET